MGTLTGLTPFISGMVDRIVNGKFYFDQISEGATLAIPNANGTTQGPDCWSVVRNNFVGGTLTARRTGATLNNFREWRITLTAGTVSLAESVSMRHVIESPLLDIFTPGTSYGKIGVLQFSPNVAVPLPTGVFIPVTFTCNSTGQIYCTLAFVPPFPPNFTELPVVSVAVPMTSNTAKWPVSSTSIGTAGFTIDFHFSPSTANLISAANVNRWIAPGAGAVAPGGSSFLINVNDFVKISDVSFQPSDITSHSRRSYADELQLVNRYYEKSFQYNIAPVQNVGNILGAASYYAPNAGITDSGVRVPYRIQKAFAPVITTYNPAAANANWHNFSQVIESGAPIVDIIDVNGFTIANPQVAGDFAGSLMAIHWTANARLS